MIARDLPSLLQLVREAKGPDRVLDVLLHIHLRGNDKTFDGKSMLDEVEDVVRSTNESEIVFRHVERHRTGPKKGQPIEGVWGYHVAGAITSSLDAVMRLVEERLPVIDWEMSSARHRKGYSAELWYTTVYRADGVTAPLALVDCLLQAVIAGEDKP